MKRVLAIAVLLFAVGRTAAAARSAAGEGFFGLTNLWEIRLTIPEAHWVAMTPAEPGPRRPGEAGPRPPGPGGFDREYPWSTATFECAGEVLTNVAIRFKGNSSFNLARGGLKRPFKIDFNRGAEAKGRRFLGHEELLLNNNANDATQFREVLAYDAFRRAGLPAPRTAFARVHLTVVGAAGERREFLGLYTVVEAVEGDFLASRFGTRKGLLVKPERLPGLQYLGEDWRTYVTRYDPKTEVSPEDRRRLIALTRLIAEAPEAEFVRELPERIDLDGFLRFVALNALLANYDSFIGNGHNYYLFLPRNGGKAAFIPWDLNEAFGGHPGAGSRLEQAGFSVLQPLGSPNRLVERVLAQPAWAAAYRRELEDLLANVLRHERLDADARLLAAVTGETVLAESPFARAGFERTALGRTNVVARPAGPPPPPGRDRPEPPPFPRPPRFGGGPGNGWEDGPFADWLSLRARNVAEELAGRRSAPSPRMMRGPGFPGRPPRPGPG